MRRDSVVPHPVVKDLRKELRETSKSGGVRQGWRLYVHVASRPHPTPARGRGVGRGERRRGKAEKVEEAVEAEAVDEPVPPEEAAVNLSS
jgi:hypothetical protein